MNEKPKNTYMKLVGLRKRRSFADETSQPLAQGVEPAFNVTDLSAVFAYRLMAIRGKKTRW
jgi:hypothetical protein